jgi:hypothetical protein
MPMTSASRRTITGRRGRMPRSMISASNTGYAAVVVASKVVAMRKTAACTRYGCAYRIIRRTTLALRGFFVAFMLQCGRRAIFEECISFSSWIYY